MGTYLISSVIVHVLEAWRCDGVAAAPRSSTLSFSGCFGDVDSCLWLLNVAKHHEGRWTQLISRDINQTESGLEARKNGQEMGRRPQRTPETTTISRATRPGSPRHMVARNGSPWKATFSTVDSSNQHDSRPCHQDYDNRTHNPTTNKRTRHKSTPKMKAAPATTTKKTTTHHLLILSQIIDR